MLGCVLLLTRYLCAAPYSVLLRKFALFSAQPPLFLSRYANFVYLGFRRLLAYRHLSAVSCGIEYRSHNGEFSVMSRDSSKGNAPVTMVTSVP